MVPPQLCSALVMAEGIITGSLGEMAFEQVCEGRVGSVMSEQSNLYELPCAYL